MVSMLSLWQRSTRPAAPGPTHRQPSLSCLLWKKPCSATLELSDGYASETLIFPNLQNGAGVALLPLGLW